MTVDAPMIHYKDEFVLGFERRQSVLRDTVTTEANVRGISAVFNVADSGNATATTRGRDGRIAARNDANSQVTVTLKEAHDKVVKTDFNIHASQGNQRELMYKTAMHVIKREMDDDIITALTAATNTNGTAEAASLASITDVITELYNQNVPNDGQLFALITPSFFNKRLMRIPEFASQDYVSTKPMVEGAPTEGTGYREWMNVKWIMHTGLPGVGTSSSTNFFYHRSAIGHAVAKNDIDFAAGYNDEDAYSYARATIYHGAALLQNEGVYKFLHNDVI